MVESKAPFESLRCGQSESCPASIRCFEPTDEGCLSLARFRRSLVLGQNERAFIGY
jgi:hypothetical protein